MTKRIAALAAVLALTLTGCAGVADNAADERTVPSSTEPAAPLVAETTSTTDAAVDGTERDFLDTVRVTLPTQTTIPDATDEQLLAAGLEACDLIRTGTSPGDVRLVEGEQPNGADIYADSSAIMNSALRTLCPELL